MEPTEQQKAVVAWRVAKGEILLLNAYAGTGKTTTLQLVARGDPKRRYLYLCFNRDNAQEARQRFPPNCTCSTIHSQAWHAVGRHFGEPAPLRPRIVMELFDLSAPYLGVYVIDTLNAFLHSSDRKLRHGHLTTGPKTPEAVRETILAVTRKLWKRMQDRDDHSIPITHDGYLKLWAMREPEIDDFDVIFLDEAQDTNPVTLEIVLAQAARKAAGVVLVGDTHQSIYAWRHAIDAMEEAAELATHRLPLTECFRFGPGIALDASILLNQLKDDPVNLTGRGVARGKPKSFAVLARTNAALIESALDKARDGMAIHFSGTSEGDRWDPFVPYKFQLTLDVYHLWNDQPRRVRDPYMKKFKSFAEVEEHARGEGEQRHGRDVELALQAELVKARGHEIPGLLDLLRKRSCGPGEADLTFSTAHRAKGREWDAVRLLDDFLDPTDEELLDDIEPVVRTEEINILYVAVTRARLRVLYPAKLFEWFQRFTPPAADTRHRLCPRDREPDAPAAPPTPPPKSARVGPPLEAQPTSLDAVAAAVGSIPLHKVTEHLDPDLREIRQRYPRAYERWEAEEDELLAGAWATAKKVKPLADVFQRQPGAIRSRLRHLGLS